MCSPSTVVIMMCSATLRPHCKQPFTLNYKVRPNKKCLLLLVKIVRASAVFSSAIGMMAQFWLVAQMPTRAWLGNAVLSSHEFVSVMAVREVCHAVTAGNFSCWCGRDVVHVS